MVFVSHANPEDNLFAQWLSLQLATHGYPVWSDVTRLLGGEDFWNDIQAAIANRTIKFVFALSQASNQKDGTLQELAYAKDVSKRLKSQIRDFIITLRIDDIPYDKIDIRVNRLNHIQFQESWSSGLAQLLAKLEEDNVPKDPRFTPSEVTEWWRTQFSSELGVKDEAEELLSNWFPVSLPDDIYFHNVSRRSQGKLDIEEEIMPYPAVHDGIFLISFARAEDFDGKLGDEMYIARPGEPRKLSEVLEEDRDFGKHLFRLLRLGWNQTLRERKLRTYELANNSHAFYFTKGQLSKDKIFFDGVEGETTWRAVVGYSSRKNPQTGVTSVRYWHFGLQARPMVHPIFAYIMKPHVLFTSDGLNIWASKKRLAAARRSQCKDWWNDEWRDRTLAVVSHLASSDDKIILKLGNDACATIHYRPVTFISPVSYADPQTIRKSTEETETNDDYDAGGSNEQDPFDDETSD
jgi:TIR domain-containing protein